MTGNCSKGGGIMGLHESCPRGTPENREKEREKERERERDLR